jgi:amino acid permease
MGKRSRSLSSAPLFAKDIINADSEPLFSQSPKMGSPSRYNTDEIVAHLDRRRWRGQHDLEAAGNGNAESQSVAWNTGRTRIPGSVVILMNAILGGGILGMAFSASRAGYILFPLLLFVMGALAFFGLHLLVDLATVYQTASYETLGQLIWGRLGRVATVLAVLVQNTGALISYVVIIGDIAPPVALQLLQHLPLSHNVLAILTSRPFLILFVMAFVSPVAFVPKIGFLQYTSFLSIGCACVFVLVIVGDCVYEVGFEGSQQIPVLEPFILSSSTFFLIPMIAFSFVCHTTVLPVYRELKNPSSGRMHIVAVAAFVICWCMFFIAGLGGYLQFGGNTKGDLLLNYSYYSLLMTAVRVIFLTGVVCTIPVLLFVARKTVHEFLFPTINWPWNIAAFNNDAADAADMSSQKGGGDNADVRDSLERNMTGSLTLSPHGRSSPWPAPRRLQYPILVEDAASVNNGSSSSTDDGANVPWKQMSLLHCIETSMLLTFIVVVATLVPEIVVVFGLSGASSSVSLVFILPGLFYLRGGKVMIKRVLAFCLVIIGIVIGVVCTSAILYELLLQGKDAEFIDIYWNKVKHGGGDLLDRL